jgi:hypothetical protein
MVALPLERSSVIFSGAAGFVAIAYFVMDEALCA